MDYVKKKVLQLSSQKPNGSRQVNVEFMSFFLQRIMLCLNDKNMSHYCIEDWISIHAYDRNVNTRKYSLSSPREIVKSKFD